MGNDKIFRELMYTFYGCVGSNDIHRAVLNAQSNIDFVWKLYGNLSNNNSIIDNQQENPGGALVEKITNGTDALLMKECMLHNIDPKDLNKAPKTVSEAVELFYGIHEGRLENLTIDRRRELCFDNLQIILEGDRRSPDIIIYDNGEGQNPSDFEDTFLSLNRGNKIDIPFVQGKYNFGSTGALGFCGKENYKYQLIVSKRNSKLNNSNGYVGFTLVRRQIPSIHDRNLKKSYDYEYLTIDGKIPSFKADSLNMNLYNKSYDGGTIIKLYSYQIIGKINKAIDISREINSLLYAPALPIAVIERRY